MHEPAQYALKSIAYGVIVVLLSRYRQNSNFSTSASSFSPMSTDPHTYALHEPTVEYIRRTTATRATCATPSPPPLVVRLANGLQKFFGMITNRATPEQEEQKANEELVLEGAMDGGKARRNGVEFRRARISGLWIDSDEEDESFDRCS
jgi:hypothetical protein